MTSPFFDLAKSIAVEPYTKPTADQLEGMAETAASGASLFGPLPFMAMCLKSEAERVRQHGPRLSWDEWLARNAEAANEP